MSTVISFCSDWSQTLLLFIDGFVQHTLYWLVSNYYTGFKCFNFSHRDPDSSSIFGQHPNRMQIWIPQVFLTPHSKQETISKWQGSQGMTPLKIWISQDMMIF